MRPSMRSPQWFLRAVFLLCPLVGPGVAAAQDLATAEALFDKGLADMKAGRHETGCPAIADSQRIDPRPGTLFTLATCEAEWGRIATAASRYRDYLNVYERLPDDKKAEQRARYKIATEMRAKLLKEVPELTLSLPASAPAGTVVKRNGAVVAETTFGMSLPVDPGEHVLSTQVPGGSIHEQRVTIGKGEKKSVMLEVKAAEVAPPPGPSVPAKTSEPEPVSAGMSGRRAATYVVGGVGLAGLAVGAVMGGVAVAQKGVMDQHCGAGIGQADNFACDQTGFDASNSAKSAALGSTIGLAVGGAALGAALVLFLTEPKATSPKTGTPAAGEAHRWISAGVLSVGPSGAMLGATGAW